MGFADINSLELIDILFIQKNLRKFSSLYLKERKTTDPPVDSLMHVTTCSPSAHHTDDENFGENSSSFTESSANLVCICRKYSKDSCHLIFEFHWFINIKLFFYVVVASFYKCQLARRNFVTKKEEFMWIHRVFLLAQYEAIKHFVSVRLEYRMNTAKHHHSVIRIMKFL